MIPACDRQTVRRSDGQTESIMANTALCMQAMLTRCNDDSHTYSTRLKDSVHLYTPNTDLILVNTVFKYRAAKFYNDLPPGN